MSALVLTKPIASIDLIEAIAIACSPILGALDMCNALGGAQTDVWQIVRTFSLSQLIDEAARRDLDLSAIKAAGCETLVFDTPPFHGAVGYDSRPRCSLCCHRHYKPSDGSELSCGDAGTFRNRPTWNWTRAARVAAVEGTRDAGS